MTSVATDAGKGWVSPEKHAEAVKQARREALEQAVAVCGEVAHDVRQNDRVRLVAGKLESRIRALLSEGDKKP